MKSAKLLITVCVHCTGLAARRPDSTVDHLYVLQCQGRRHPTTDFARNLRRYFQSPSRVITCHRDPERASPPPQALIESRRSFCHGHSERSTASRQIALHGHSIMKTRVTPPWYLRSSNELVRGWLFPTPTNLLTVVSRLCSKCLHHTHVNIS